MVWFNCAERTDLLQTNKLIADVGFVYLLNCAKLYFSPNKEINS